MKHQQTLRHSTKSQFTIISKKRKTPPNSMPLSFEEIKPCKGNEIESNVLKSGYSPKKKKSKQPEKTQPETLIKIDLDNPNSKKSLNPRPWLVWKDQSCRLDAFFTIVVFAILNDKSFDFSHFCHSRKSKASAPRNSKKWGYKNHSSRSK